MKQKILISSLFLVLLLAACAPAQTAALPAAATSPQQAADTAANAQQVDYSPTIAVNTDMLNAVQTTFQQIYQNVNPSVVNIQVTQDAGQFGVTGGEGLPVAQVHDPLAGLDAAAQLGRVRGVDR